MLPNSDNVDSDNGTVDNAIVYPTCVRCKDTITSGHAYELGDDRWHTHCFSCYRCEKPLSCDSDFLVLGTGTLICFDCSDSCKSCGKKIDDLAIILSSSNEAYCSECFKCCKCGDTIKDLRYAKTKRGLFCIHCHEKLLAKRKYYEEKKRRLKKNLPDIPSADLPIPLVIPEKSSKRPLSPPRAHQRSSSFQSFSKGMVKSNSESVISQYLDENDEVSSKGSMNSQGDDKKSEKAEEIEIKVSKPESGHSRNVSIDDMLNSTLENDEIDNKEGFREDKARVLLNKTPLRNHRATNSITKSPISHRRGMILDSIDSQNDEQLIQEDKALNAYEDQISRDVDESLGSGVAFSGSKNDSMLGKENVDNAEMGREETRGLALHLPSRELKTSTLGRDEDTLVLEADDEPAKDAGASTFPSSPLPDKVHEASKAANSISRSLTVANHALSPPRGANSGNGSKRIGRSLSLKSKNLVHNLKSRTTGMLDPRSSTSPTLHLKNQPSPNTTVNAFEADLPGMDLDTHSGWGVSSVEEKKIPVNPAASSRHRTTPRGKSDTTLQSAQRNDREVKKHSTPDALDHRRTQSNASINSTATNVSMFRTPPLENSSIFGRLNTSGSTSHYRASSWQANNEAVEEESVKLRSEGEVNQEVEEDADNETFVKRELVETELLLRKLKLDLRELESRKLHLTNEVDNLQSSKDMLLQEIEQIKAEKSKFSSVESLVPIQQNNETEKSQDSNSSGTSPGKHTETVSVARPATKPRFWKIFSGARQPAQSQHMNHYQQNQNIPNGFTTNPSLSSSSSIPNGSNTGSRPEISGPVLQNPHEFSDMKLLPISLNSQSEVSMQSSPSRVEGTLLYGSSLVARCSYEQSAIPAIIKACADHIESKEEYLKTEGIYRKSGSQLLIEEIEKAFTDCDTTLTADLLRLLDEDIHAVASVLKRYLRKLPNPVLTFQVYEPLIKIVRDNRMMTNLPLKSGNAKQSNPQYVSALDTIVKILDNLPKEHYDLLKFLAHHINTVTSYSEWNLMNLYNLSLVFAPGLIRDYTGDKDIIDMKERNYIVGFIFGNYGDIF